MVLDLVRRNTWSDEIDHQNDLFYHDLQEVLCEGERRAVEQRGANAEVHADLCACSPEPKEVLRTQRHLPLPG